MDILNRLVVVDGNSLINRCFYGIKQQMRTKSGLYTHAIYGFINIIEKIKTDYLPYGIIVTFDSAAKTFRHEKYKEYKANRKGMPDELFMQLEPLQNILDALNIPVIAMDGFEADDLIGSITLISENEGYDSLVVTGDHDLLQLVSERTYVLITKRGMSETIVYDPVEVENKYSFGVEKLVDLKALMGDASDNIPGIPGVGEKTATKLLKDFDSLEDIISNVEKIKNKNLREKIEDNIPIAYMSKQLAKINRNAPIEIELSECDLKEADTDKLVKLYTDLEFNQFLKRMNKDLT